MRKWACGFTVVALVCISCVAQAQTRTKAELALFYASMYEAILSIEKRSLYAITAKDQKAIRELSDELGELWNRTFHGVSLEEFQSIDGKYEHCMYASEALMGLFDWLRRPIDAKVLRRRDENLEWYYESIRTCERELKRPHSKRLLPRTILE